ncbi:MAG: OB-fold domain-containing protein [Rubrobacter sp.]|nr:OB-fold domain-containing protein [Rubrobacter sp.]
MLTFRRGSVYRRSGTFDVEEVEVTGRDASAGTPAEVYRRYLEGGKLGFQRCGDCAAAVFYPRVICPVCGSASLFWETSSGRGTVYATTAVHRRNREPYNVSLVDLEEGFRIMSRIEDPPAEEVKIGMHVRLRVDETEEGPVVVFFPSGGAEDVR